MLRRTTLLMVFPLALGLTACPAASRPPPAGVPTTPAELTKLGQVSLNTFRSADGTSAYASASASFERLAQRDADVLDRELVEGCAVYASDEEPPFEVIDADYIDAGPNVTLYAGGQLYAVLDKVESFGGIFYQAGGDLGLGVLPPVPESALSVTVPGATFPAFEDVAMPVPPPAFTLDNPDELTPLTAESRLRWTPPQTTGDVRSSVSFTAYHLDEKGFVYLWCVGADDGDFAFTGEVGEALSEKGFVNGQLFELNRFFERVETGGDAALLLSTSVTTEASPGTTAEVRGRLTALRRDADDRRPYRLR